MVARMTRVRRRRSPAAIGPPTAALLVHVSDPRLVDDLTAWLERVRCMVDRVDERTLEVSIRNALPEGADDVQLDLFLRVWEVRHGDVARARRVG
jgi:hypothetical protein